jgi:hypothetical protein
LVVRVRGSYGLGEVTTPKSGKVRSVPPPPDVAEALARLGARVHFVGEDDHLHHAPRAEDAATVARAFRIRSSPAPSADQANIDSELKVEPAAVGRQDG